jgi:hypothetical protein
VFVLFLPGLVFVGMEHTLHAALVVQAFVLLRRLESSELALRQVAPYLVVLFLATLFRYESMFLAGGCALALLLLTTRRFGTADGTLRWGRVAALRLAVLSVGVSVLPVVAVGLVNRANDQEFLNNSVALKSAVLRGGGELGWLPTPGQFVGRLQEEPVVLLLVLVAVGYLLSAAFDGPRGNVSISVVYVVLVAGHTAFAQFGTRLPYTRYQAYLVIAGTFLALRVLAEVVPPPRRRAALAFALVALALLVNVRIELIADLPTASSNSYRQRYQMGLFLREHYDGRGIATGELGYSTYLHDGPVVDLFGLGDHEVLLALKELEEGAHPKFLPPDYLRELIDRRGVDVIAVYPETLEGSLPPEWHIAGEWQLRGPIITAFQRQIQFYAPDERRGRELEENLRAFAPRLPDGVEVFDRQDLVDRFLAAAD